jgi:hypothetical protein
VESTKVIVAVLLLSVVTVDVFQQSAPGVQFSTQFSGTGDGRAEGVLHAQVHD